MIRREFLRWLGLAPICAAGVVAGPPASAEAVPPSLILGSGSWYHPLLRPGARIIVYNHSREIISVSCRAGDLVITVSDSDRPSRMVWA